MKPTLIAAAAAVMLAAGAALAAAPPAYVAKAVADPSRPARDVKTDASRMPAETLAFSGVKPGMTVAELFPGGGYYTRMLSDIVGPNGKVMTVENTGWQSAVKADQAMADSLAVKNVSLDPEPFGQMKFPAGKADLFWITQNYHDLKIAKYGVVDMAAFNKAVYATLKPGGAYVIIDHEANPGLTTEQIEKLHRIEKATVIREVTAVGFKLAGEGKFLNRASDDHTKEIFDPAVQGKTDQYALKFVKPA